MIDKILHVKLLLTLLMFSGGCCHSQNRKPENDTIAQMKEEIQGSWIMKNDATSKLIFGENGQVKEYADGELISTKNYDITTSCNGETSNNTYFLKTFAEEEEDNPSCAYIEGINCDNNHILSLMTTNQGKIIVYERP